LRHRLSEAAGDITGVIAKFTAFVAVGSKFRTAMITNKTVCCFSIKLFFIRHPPSSAAFIGTKLFQLPSGDYLRFLSALFTICNVRAYLVYGLVQIIPLAV